MATKNTAPKQAELTKEERTKVINAAYAHAAKTVREENLDRFHELQREHALAHGVDWTPPLTKEQRAEAEMQKLLEAHPHLRDRFSPS